MNSVLWNLLDQYSKVHQKAEQARDNSQLESEQEQLTEAEQILRKCMYLGDNNN
jgi:hypothetical protein